MEEIKSNKSRKIIIFLKKILGGSYFQSFFSSFKKENRG